MQTFLLTLFIIICILLIIVVLLQKGRGGGLSGAFGGGMTSTAFGTRTGDVFTWVTIVLTSLFLLLAVVDTFLFRPADQKYIAQFSPPPNTVISKDTPVTISIYPRSPADAKVVYTLDGSDPTEKSKVYLKDLMIKPGQTIRAAVLRRNKLGEVRMAHFPSPSEAATMAATEPVEAPASPSPASRSASGPAASPSASPAASSRPAASASPLPVKVDGGKVVVDPNLVKDILKDANLGRLPATLIAHPTSAGAAASSPTP